MRKPILIIIFSIIVITAILTSCGENNQKSGTIPAETTTEQYQCPMKCTEEVFDKAGKCPVCEMELEKVGTS